MREIPQKASLRCKKRLFLLIPYGLKPLKMSLRCWERPIEDTEIVNFRPCRAGLAMVNFNVSYITYMSCNAKICIATYTHTKPHTE